MKLICEQIENIQYVVEAKESGKKDYFIEGIFMQGDVQNRNGRVYPVSVLQREAERYMKEAIAQNRAYGELGHPNGPSINLDRVSHMIKELRQDGNNFYGRAKIMDTPMGNIVKSLMDEGGQLGVSTRGMGSLRENKKGFMEVQDDFHLATAADIVADPSAPDAFVRGIMEGVEFWYEDGILKKKEIAAYTAKASINNLAKTNSLDENALLEVFNAYLKAII
jgi:hypothetical protein